VLERQQQNLLAFPDYDLLKLDIDAGGVQSRRIIDRIIAKEQAAKQQPKASSSSNAPLQTASF
jgi:vanillate O-demethylase monooxygenase subunit